ITDRELEAGKVPQSPPPQAVRVLNKEKEWFFPPSAGMPNEQGAFLPGDFFLFGGGIATKLSVELRSCVKKRGANVKFIDEKARICYNSSINSIGRGI
ncbi:MAG: hypothetical protein J6T24_08110, partial [Clostridia bacterium]|nr:hypothetical protein [Clostridia bacterium]